MENYSYDVFISYRWVAQDKEWVREQLYPALTSAGLKVCIDVIDFIPGKDMMLEMRRLCNESQHVLCVVIPEYLEKIRWLNLNIYPLYEGIPEVESHH